MRQGQVKEQIAIEPQALRQTFSCLMKGARASYKAEH